MPAFDDVLQLIISKDELLELYSVLASGAHQDDLLRASQALLSLWPPEHTGLPVHGVFHEVLLQGILVRLSPRHDPDTVPFHDDNDEAPGYVLRPLHRVVVPDSAAASGGESTGLEVELCHVEGRLQPNSDAGLNASAAADAAGPGRWHGADDGLHAGMGPGGDAAMGGVDGAQAQPASAPSQSSSCSCSWCQYLTWRGVFRLPLEKLWPEPEEEEQAGASDAEGRASWELGYMIAREELFGAHALFLHPAAAPPVTVAVLQLLRSLACRLRLRHAISQHASARKQLQARLQAVTSELSDAKQQAREELEAEPGLGPTRGQPGQPLPVAASSASASRLRRDTALEQWRVQQQRWRTGKGQVEQLKQRADELERQRQAVIVELKQVMNAERAAEQQADLLEADAGELLQSLTEAVHEERRQRNARHNAEPAPHAAAAAAAAAVPQQAAADQEAGGSFEPPLSKRPRLEQHAADAADGLRGPAAAGTVTGGDGGRTASDDWSCVQPNGQRLGGLAAMPPSHQPQAPQDPGVGPGRPGVAGDHSKWSALQKEYLLARAMMLRLADMHGAVSGDGSQVDLSRLPEAARPQFIDCKRRAAKAGVQLVAWGEPVPTDVHVLDCFLAMKEQQQRQQQPGQQGRPQPQSGSITAGSVSGSGGATEAASVHQVEEPQRPQLHWLQSHRVPHAPMSSCPAAASHAPMCGLAGPTDALGHVPALTAAAQTMQAAAGVASDPAALAAAALPPTGPAKPPRPGPKPRMQQTPAHLQPLQRSTQPAPALTGPRSRSRSPAPTAICALAEPAAGAQPAIVITTVVPPGIASGSYAAGQHPSVARAAFVAMPTQPLEQQQYLPSHQHNMPHMQQQQQQQLSLQAQPHLMYTHPHPHQQLQRQPGLQLQQPVQQAQPWQSGAGPAGYREHVQGMWVQEGYHGQGCAPLGPPSTGPAVSLAPAAPAATRSHPHHHQQPQPAITSAFAWEGAVELVWAPQASASVPGSAGATAAPSRIVQCLPGARLLVSPLPASPRLKIDRAFSGLAALLQQAGVTVLPIVAAAKDKQVAKLEPHLSSYRYLAPEVGLLTFAAQPELMKALAFTAAHGLSADAAKAPQQPQGQPGATAVARSRVRYVVSSVTLKQGPATGQVLSFYLFSQASGVWAQEVLAAGLPGPQRTLFASGQALLLLAQLAPGSAVVTNSSGVAGGSGGSLCVPAAPSQPSAKATSPLASGPGASGAAYGAVGQQEDVVAAAAAMLMAGSLAAQAGKQLPDLQLQSSEQAADAAATSRRLTDGGGNSASQPTVAAARARPSQPATPQPASHGHELSVGRLTQASKPAADGPEAEGELSGLGRPDAPGPSALPPTADNTAAGQLGTGPSKGVIGVVGNSAPVHASAASSSKPGALETEGAEEDDLRGLGSPGPLWPPLGPHGRTLSPIYTFASDIDD